MMKGKPFRQGAVLSRAHITDVAPTLLYLLGVPVPAEMDGQVLSEAFEGEFVASHPVQYHQGGLLMHGNAALDAAYTAEETEKIQERLKGLGYID
jgi:arylsulfatase A-like enzyme